MPRSSSTGQRAFEVAASLRPPILDEAEAASSGGHAESFCSSTNVGVIKTIVEGSIRYALEVELAFFGRE